MTEITHSLNSARLLADVGGTNARFAWQAGPGAAIEAVKVLPVAEHARIQDAIRCYLDDLGRGVPGAVAIAIANPITGDQIHMTNATWSFSQAAVKAEFGFSTLRLLNDFTALAMSEVVVNRGATAGMVELRVEVDGHFVANQRADGLIIATPTGCTAYALSAGGPLIHPSIPGWVLVPIAPHTLSNRPIVLPNVSEVVLELVSGRDASANFDMQSLASLIHGDRIVVTRSQYQVRFLHPKGWTYFDTLRQKLHWNEGAA